MATSPNKLSQFWQELKRRNVVRVVTVYAGAAFVILELVDIIAEPLKLPSWLLPVVIVLLSIGFIIAVILSWIYDIHPEEGVVKTGPSEKAKAEDVPKSSNSWKIASYISFVVIIGLIVLNIIPRSSNKKILDKSIAVLPFVNDSPVSENAHFIRGYMTAVHNNLCQIKDLRVLTLQSTEQYRNDTKSTPDIARELGVGYLLTAHGQILNNKIRLTVQLADAEDEIIWSNPYDRQIKSVEDHFEIQSNIAQLVASKLQSTITPEEKQRIEKISTSNATAFEFYQRGMENYRLGDLDSAVGFFDKALNYDSTYAQAYVGLAQVQWDKQFWETYYSETFLDSVLTLLEIAISYDSVLSEAYTLRGYYFNETGNYDMAIKEFNKALEFNPNDAYTLIGLAQCYRDYDIVLSVDNLQKAISLSSNTELPVLYKSLAVSLAYAGFVSEPKYYYQKAMKIDGDSASFFRFMTWVYACNGNYKEALKFANEALDIDSTNAAFLSQYGWILLMLGREGESLKVYQQWYERISESGEKMMYGILRMALAYYENGMLDEAEYYFDEQILAYQKEMELGRRHNEILYTYLDIAAIQAFRGNKEIALENLRKFKEKQSMPIFVLTLIMRERYFEKLHTDSEFLEIYNEIESKYKAEHERVRQWLEENNML